jgi:hypothetical protein
MHGISLFKNHKIAKESRHILVVVSVRWQLAGFLMAARRHAPKKITIIKLRPFNITSSDFRTVDEINVSIINAFGFHDIISPGFFVGIKRSFLSFDRFRREVLNHISYDNFVIITDNEHRAIEYFLRFCLASISSMHVYGHGLVKRESDWRALTMRTLKGIVRWNIFRVITVLNDKKTLLIGNVINKQYYHVNINEKNNGCNISGDIFLYANSLKFSEIQKDDSNVLIFFSSGAFRYSDDRFIRDTVAAYLITKCYAEKNEMQLYVKLKEMESKQYLIDADKTLNLNQFIGGDLDFYDCINNYHPQLLVCGDFSTIVAESSIYSVDVLMYQCASPFIAVSHSEKWVDAGVEMITPDGIIPKNRGNTEELIKELYNINGAKEHLEALSP